MGTAEDRPVVADEQNGRPHLDTILDRHDAGEARANTGRMARRGAKWLGAANLASQVTRIATTIVLARLLAPEVFGVVALVTVVTGFFERFLGDTGTSAAVVQKPELTQRLASSVFWFNLGLGSMTSLAFVIVGGPVARALGEPSAAAYVRALGLTAAINALSYVQQSLLRRQGRFKPLAVARYVNVCATSSIAIVLAFSGLEVWALIIGTLTGSALWIVVLWTASSWRPSLHLARADLSQIRRFSGNITAFNFFGYFVNVGDRLIVGRFLGPLALGYYGMSNRLLRYPVQTGIQPFREVVLPMLSKLQDDRPAMGEVYIRTVAALALALMPVTIGVAVMADPLVRTALGERWEPAIPVISIIALVATLQAITSTTGSLFIATGRTDIWFRWGVGSAAVTMACYLVGLRWGIEGVAWGYLIAIAALTVPSFIIPFRLIGLPISHLVRAVGPIALAVGALAAAAFGSSQAAAEAGAGPALELAAGVAAGALAYAASILVLRPQALRDLLSLAREDRNAFLG